VNGRYLLLTLGCWLALILPAGAADPPPGRLISEPIFGGQCYLVELGREHPERLLLIHGIGNEAGRNWDSVLPELARRYHVLVPDLPGFGRSTRANRLYSPENYAAFIDWLLRREPEQPTIVVGHSLGGAVALAYAGRYGQDLAGLVLVDAVGVLHRVTISKDFVQKRLHFDGPFFPEGAQGFFQRLAGRLVEKFSPPRDDLDQVLASEKLRATTLDGAPERIAGLALVQTDFTPFLAGIRTPTWLLWGENDTIAPRRLALLLQGLLPRAELRLLPGLGHTPMTEDPAAFAEALDSALTTQPQPRPRPAPPAGERVGICNGQRGVNFSGPYRRLEISNCRDVNITDAYISTAVIDRSLVTMTNTVIAGDATGLFIRASTLRATAVEISAATALVADQCRLDLAGVRLTGSRTAVRDEREASTLVFSVSTLKSGGKERPIHAVVVLAPGEEL
jgi:pimeloyl-ACP methyl ester carboxylesterase